MLHDFSYLKINMFNGNIPIELLLNEMLQSQMRIKRE